MFTGIVQQTGRLMELDAASGRGRLVVEASAWDRPLEVGESIAVNGVCLTLARVQGNRLEFDILRETFERTNLGRQAAGARLNLERALRLGEPLGGHIINGHVDATGVLRELRRVDDRDRQAVVECPPALMSGLVPKGCVACDGVSLTVVEVGSEQFTVHLIPHTWQHTAWSDRRAGDGVNLEVDVVAKYVRRCLDSGAAPAVSWDALRRHGLIA
jgi:riboflavin synthase